MRHLDDKFIEDLKSGKLSPLLEAVHRDRDLIIDIVYRSAFLASASRLFPL